MYGRISIPDRLELGLEPPMGDGADPEAGHENENDQYHPQVRQDAFNLCQCQLPVPG